MRTSKHRDHAHYFPSGSLARSETRGCRARRASQTHPRLRQQRSGLRRHPLLLGPLPPLPKDFCSQLARPVPRDKHLTLDRGRVGGLRPSCRDLKKTEFKRWASRPSSREEVCYPFACEGRPYKVLSKTMREPIAVCIY